MLICAERFWNQCSFLEFRRNCEYRTSCLRCCTSTAEKSGAGIQGRSQRNVNKLTHLKILELLFICRHFAQVDKIFYITKICLFDQNSAAFHSSLPRTCAINPLGKPCFLTAMLQVRRFTACLHFATRILTVCGFLVAFSEALETTKTQTRSGMTRGREGSPNTEPGHKYQN